MKLRHDLILITWDDAGELGLGWVQDSEVEAKEMLVTTIGFQLKKTKSHYIIASTVSEPYANHAQFQIPTKMVKKVEVIAKKGQEFPNGNGQAKVIREGNGVPT